MIKNLVLPFLLFFSLVALAQQQTASPYSFYGIGDVRFRGAVENRLMGGVSVFPDSIHINMQNPASYSGLKLTTFTVAGSFNATRLTSFRETENAQRTTFDYLAVGLPIMRKVGVGFGLVPYSAVGYRIRTQDPVTGSIRKYDGTGGVNRAFLSVGYAITPSLSIGVDANYNFGNIETTSISAINGNQYATMELDNSKLAGFNVNFGAMYKKVFKDKLTAFGSLTYTPESKLRSTNERNVGLTVYTEETTPVIFQGFDTEFSKVDVTMPSKLAIGAGFGKERKWLAGAEVTFLQTAEMGNRFADISNTTFENSVRYSFGGYYIPNYNSFTNYFSKVVYRAGFRYEHTGLIVNNEKIRDYAVTGGFGFPLGGTFSNLNIGVEYGRRGTAKALLVEENYTNVILSLSLNDQWFIKRRYD